MHLVEKVTSDISRMKEAIKETGLPKPVFKTKVTFWLCKTKILYHE